MPPVSKASVRFMLDFVRDCQEKSSSSSTSPKKHRHLALKKHKIANKSLGRDNVASQSTRKCSIDKRKAWTITELVSESKAKRQLISNSTTSHIPNSQLNDDRDDEDDAICESLKMKAPVIDGFEVETLISTHQSCLWIIRNYLPPDLFHSSDFEALELTHNPKFELYNKICESKRSVRFFTQQELESAKRDIDMKVDGVDGSTTAMYIIEYIRSSLSDDLNFPFNGVLLNEYKDGTHNVGSHSDKEVMPGDCVAALAFGATRNFRIRCKVTKRIVLDIPHTPGMLIVMAGGFQNEYRHEIPIQVAVKDPRVSLTFRKHHRLLLQQQDKQHLEALV